MIVKLNLIGKSAFFHRQLNFHKKCCTALTLKTQEGVFFEFTILLFILSTFYHQFYTRQGFYYLDFILFLSIRRLCCVLQEK